MMLVPHACVNAAAGRLFKSSLAALGAGILSHALLDLTPHKDVSAHKAEGLAVLIILGLVGSSCGWTSPPFWCAVGGVLPDVEHVLPWTDPKRGHHRWFPTHNRHLHSLRVPGRPDYRVRLLTQAVASGMTLMAGISACSEK